MKICIRDDDLCYWSNYELFKKVYEPLGIPVSASVTPYGVCNHADIFPFGIKESDQPRDILENQNLVKSLKNDIKNKKVEILLHGYTHQYKLIKNNWVPEMIWKQKEQILEEVTDGKNHLEEIFNQKITVFVAPSQEIDKKGIDALEKNNLNFSGMASRLNQRKFSFRFLVFLFRRFFNRIRYGIAIQGIMKYKKHKELGIIPILDINSFIKIFNICKKHNWDIVIVSHYWEIDENKEKYSSLKQIIEYSKKDGVQFEFLSNLFE